MFWRLFSIGLARSNGGDPSVIARRKHAWASQFELTPDLLAEISTSDRKGSPNLLSGSGPPSHGKGSNGSRYLSRTPQTRSGPLPVVSTITPRYWLRLSISLGAAQVQFSPPTLEDAAKALQSSVSRTGQPPRSRSKNDDAFRWEDNHREGIFGAEDLFSKRSANCALKVACAVPLNLFYFQLSIPLLV